MLEKCGLGKKEVSRLLTVGANYGQDKKRLKKNPTATFEEPRTKAESQK